MNYTVVMPYLGGVLSENSYKFHTRKTKPVVRLWMKELSEKVESLNIPEADGYTIGLYGKFWDGRGIPDLSNLHKVIGDALKKTRTQKGLGIDDQAFLFVDKGYELGKFDPELIITIEPNEIVLDVPRVISFVEEVANLVPGD